jgi:TPR repeat protein
MKYYLMAIKHGNTDGIINIANYYKDVKNDHQTTKKYYINASEKGNHKGMFLLAEYYYVIENNMDEAIKYYLMEAKHGNLDAMYLAGVFFFKIEKDIPNTLKYFKMAADHGNAFAMNGLANYYRDIDHNIELGLQYYKMAAENGNVDAMHSLATHYFTNQDFPMMIKYAELAVAHGHDDLYNQLGMHYSYYENNPTKAIEHFMIGVKKGNLDSLVYMGIQYHALGDIEKYEKYLTEAFQKGNIIAANHLGLHYQYGKNNYDKASECFKVGVEKDNSDSFLYIGILYDFMKEYELSEKYLLIALEKGHIKAANYLGFYYQNHKQDYPKALEYFKIGVENDDTQSYLNFASLSYLMGEYDLSEKYFLIAVEKGDDVAGNNLGFYYQHIKQDYVNAEKYYKIAHERGEQFSLYNLYSLYKTLEDKHEETEKCYQKILEINSKTGIFTDLLS